jgi:hypothetical protein
MPEHPIRTNAKRTSQTAKNDAERDYNRNIISDKKRKTLKLGILIIISLLVIQLYALQFILINDELTEPDFDFDDDGLPNDWEIEYHFNPRNPNDRNIDPDNDTLTNIQEFENQTDPHNVDSDWDNLPDPWEIKFGLNPINKSDRNFDLDSDGLTNFKEFSAGTDPTNEDTDSDGIIDTWELTYALNPLNASDFSLDKDNDNLINLDEFLNNTDPLNKDTDFDTMDDFWEINNNLNPNNNSDAEADYDNDSLTNTREYLYKLDPWDFDFDNDLLPDGWEVSNNLDPTKKDHTLDHDDDGLNNLQEFENSTDPRNHDTDLDKIPDLWEVTHALNPTEAYDSLLDYDNDFLTNYMEYQNDLNPFSSDTDSDKLPDNWELKFDLDPKTNDSGLDPDQDGLINLLEFQLSTMPNDPDSDDDFLPDGWEWVYGLNAINSSDAGFDVDKDGLTNLEEFLNKTDPTKKDTDSDSLPDGWEVQQGLNATRKDADLDSDKDGLTNLKEYELGTIPLNPDSDGDLLPDGWEILHRRLEYNPISGKDEWTLNPLNNDTNENGTVDGSEDFDQDGVWYDEPTKLYDPYSNYEEFLNGSDPYNPDSDSDSLPDGWEAVNDLSPTVDDHDLDKDNDGLTNFQEYQLKLAPNNNDTDDDLLNDKTEIDIYGTDPKDRDTDNDTMGDGFEILIRGSDPFIPNHFYVILINTGDPDNPSDPTWRDSKIMDQTLRKYYGYNDSMIWKYEKGAATFKNFKKAVNEITALSDANDTIYFNFAAHGNPGYLQFNDGIHYYSEIDGWLDNITCDRMIVSIDACFSGSAISPLNDGDNPAPRVIYTACKEDEESDGTFHAKFTDALGFSPLEHDVADSDFGTRDGLGNGYVSVREAFLYAADYVSKWCDVDNDGNCDTPEESNSTAFWENTYLGEYRN